MFWSKSRIERLQRDSAEAQARIRDLFLNRRITLPTGGYGWGQFLDDQRDDTQYGIYGTSAGIQVLVLGGHPHNQEPVNSASRLLEQAYSDQTDNNIFRRKGDLTVLYKLLYMAQAAHLNEDDVIRDDELMNDIVNRVIGNQGWGEFYISEQEKDFQPRMGPTSLALLILYKYRPFRTSSSSR